MSLVTAITERSMAGGTQERPPLGIPDGDLRRDNPFYDQRTGRYIHPEERQCPELAEEFVAAYDACVLAWSEGHRLRCEHGCLTREERHLRQREIAETERRLRANELHRERRLIAVEAPMREIVGRRGTVPVFQIGAEDAETFEPWPLECDERPSSLAEVETVFAGGGLLESPLSLAEEQLRG